MLILAQSRHGCKCRVCSQLPSDALRTYVQIVHLQENACYDILSGFKISKSRKYHCKQDLEGVNACLDACSVMDRAIFAIDEFTSVEYCKVTYFTYYIGTFGVGF